MPLHLVAAGVPGGDQEIGQIIQIADLAHGEGAADCPEPVRGQGALHEALHCGRQHRAVPLVQGSKNCQPLVLPLAGGSARMKLKVPGREEGNLSAGEGGQIPGCPPGLPLVGADHHQGTAGVLVQGGGQMGPVDRG